MTTKSELFAKYNGKQFQIDDANLITCDLKSSWSLKKIQEVIDKWEADVTLRISFNEWKTKLLSHAAKLYYTPDAVKWTYCVTYQQFLSSNELEEDIKKLEEALFEHPSKHQYTTIKQLIPNRLNRHIRLYGEGLIAVGSSEGNWFKIQLDGSYSPINNPLHDTQLYSHYTFVGISEDIGIVVRAEKNSLRAFIQFQRQDTDPNSYKVEVFYSEYQEHVGVALPGYGSLEPKVAIQAAEALKLGAEIAQDFNNFLDNPHDWICQQCKPPRPFDAVLSR
jgi:hypothetical protein